MESNAPCPFRGVCGAHGNTLHGVHGASDSGVWGRETATPTEGKIVNKMESLDMSREEPPIAAF